MGANGSTSKRRSAANSASKPPKSAVFFLDRSLGKKVIASALRQSGVKVEVHDDYFAPDAPDETWLRSVGAWNWVVLTKDRRIRYRTIERTALLASGVRSFVLTAGDLQGHEMAAIFLKAIPKMLRILGDRPGPFIATLTKGGQIKIIAPA